jgi:DUF1680 family protein
MHEVRWTGGFWADKFTLCHKQMLPTIHRALLDPRNSEHLKNFRVAAGLEEGEYRSTNWSDGDCYKWLEAMALIYAVTKDPQLEALLDEWIEVIRKAQRADGFISTNAQLSDRVKPLDLPYTHQLYNFGHLLTAGVVHHQATGKDTFLQIARKAANYLYDQFSPRPARLVHFPWNPSVYVGLVDLYRATGEERYLELAKIMIDNRGSSPGDGDHRNGGTDQTQDRVPIRQEFQAEGHAVCATYLYCGVADLYMETGEKALLEALKRIWGNIHSRRSFITGAVGVGGGKSSRGDPVHEAFQADYHLPSRTAYAETCANIGHGMWNWRMLCITGEARYGDAMERVVYNTLLSPVSLDGTGFFYCNPLKWTGESAGPTKHHTATRWSIHRCYCCPPQVARKIAGLQRWAYGLSQDEVWVHLYGSNALDSQLPNGSRIRLRQDSRYPWDGKTQFTVMEAPNHELALKFRIPSWSPGAQIKINNKPFSGPVHPGTYASVRRRWSAGDIVELDLPLPVTLMEAHPLVKEVHNQVAITRGPIVYCLELPKRENGERIWKDGVFLPDNIKLQPRFEKSLLGGVVTLKGNALTYKGRDLFIQASKKASPPRPGPDWGDMLYRPFQARPLPPADTGMVEITLTPYYTWANRGESYMEVWIPLVR